MESPFPELEPRKHVRPVVESTGLFCVVKCANTMANQASSLHGFGSGSSSDAHSTLLYFAASLVTGLFAKDSADSLRCAKASYSLDAVSERVRSRRFP